MTLVTIVTVVYTSVSCYDVDNSELCDSMSYSCYHCDSYEFCESPSDRCHNWDTYNTCESVIDSYYFLYIYDT